ncbi:pyridoxamine 5'-phosphate oxidase family protein [Roseateles sp. SL47]|uniref:MSMEG_1061 family FMN-dependent PPOX-type flavoprotein n=1 Tax=Roseateles sp. SL47 TaxID=2995138 RepID=UPI00226FC72A|nr:MSMEG_1061 family FMN-dependent PPOX-type flavoprotein [Roseateles sp. SL47]WAC75383.1 pyridoxamine 5'-phosphate oxidase family protein [Roseateles sp. SL47]
MTTNDTQQERHDNWRRPDLDALYDPPAERIQKAVLPHLVGSHIEYLKAATFFCLATGSKRGLDASPRGGPPGFVRVLDSRTVTYADWPGNNRIESLRNLESDDRLGMLFLFPGLEIFMRINGRGRISTEPSLLATLKEGERMPKTATVVSIDEVLMHCGKAVNRAKLWQDDSRIDRHALPTVGQMLAELTQHGDPQAGMSDEQIGQANAQYQHRVRNDLY